MSVWFPRLPIDRFLRRRQREHPESPTPILLAARSGQRQCVVDCCPLADRAGVQAGMALADARALLPDGSVQVYDARPDDDAAALHALAIWAERYSPMVAIDPPDGLLMDVSGCGRVFGGDQHLAWNLVRRCQGDFCQPGKNLRIRARVAVAPTFGAAWALARCSHQPVTLVGPQELIESLGSLPLSALRVDSQTVQAVQEIGVRTIGELLALPRSVLPSRFGPALLFRLDQALGGAMEVIHPVRPAEPPRVERLFDGPTTQVEALERVMRELLGMLTGRLAARGQGVSRLAATLTRSDLPPIGLHVMLTSATGDARHLWTLLRPKLERAHLGFGVEAVTLFASRLGPLRGAQAECWPDPRSGRETADDQRLSELLDTLSNQLGVEHVLQTRTLPSHLPERAFGRVPIIGDHADLGPIKRAHRAHIVDRPTLLHDRPAPIGVTCLTPDGPVVSLQVRGESMPVAVSIGPERISPEWWRQDEPVRDYFRVQDHHGRWLWIYRQLETGRWFLHGVWA